MKKTIIRKILIALVIIGTLISVTTALAEPEYVEKNEEITSEIFEEYSLGFNTGNGLGETKQDEIGDHDPGRTGTNLNENEYDCERTATLIEVEIVNFEDTLSAAQVKDEYNGDAAQGKYEVDLIKLDVKGKVSGGLYVTEYGPDGQKKETLEPGITAEGQVAITVVEIDAEGRVGNDDINLHGKGELDCLDAKAKGKAELGFVDGKLAAKGELSAEANLVEAGGEAGFEVFGIDAKVSGSVKVGVGAKLEVGYSDGKFSCKIGASLGVGAEAGFEIDVSKLVKNMEDAYNTISEFFGNPVPQNSGIDLTGAGGAPTIGVPLNTGAESNPCINTNIAAVECIPFVGLGIAA